MLPLFLIEAFHLSKNYAEAAALKDFSLFLKAGEIIGLLGPNGAGKTTVIHMILGILKPTSGRVRVLGLDPLTDHKKIAPWINFSSAYTQLPSNLTVMENLKVFSRIYGIPNARAKIDRLLTVFSMTAMASRVAGALSSGEKTRLNLCKALVNDPVLLLLDEPTASLDPEMAANVRTVLKKIQAERKMGILYTSHNMNEVAQMCERVLFLNRGELVEEGSPQDLLRKYQRDGLEEVFLELSRRRPG